MADSDRTAVDVELVAERVDAELTRRRDDLRRERLVDLDEVDVVDALAGTLERQLGGLDRAETHDLRRQTGDSGRQDPRERGEAGRLGLGVAHDDDRSGAVVERARVAGGDGAVGPEHRLERGHALDRDAGTGAVVLRHLGAVGLGHRDDLALPETVGDGLLGEVL